MLGTVETLETPKKQTIVIVEDNASLAEIYKTRLELLDYTCFVAENGIVGLYFIQKQRPDLVLLDMMVPDIAGDQILARMRSSDWGKNIPVFVISNLNETDAPKNLRELGISGYAVKANMTDDEVDRIVNSILRPNVQPSPEESTPLQTTTTEIPVAAEPDTQSSTADVPNTDTASVAQGATNVSGASAPSEAITSDATDTEPTAVANEDQPAVESSSTTSSTSQPAESTPMPQSDPSSDEPVHPLFTHKA